MLLPAAMQARQTVTGQAAFADTGYEVVCISTYDGRADGSCGNFLTGLVTKDGQLWDRPAGSAIGKVGTLFVTDVRARSVRHVSCAGK